MRLLHYDGSSNISLTKDLLPNGIPGYAILSHTWGGPDDEVTFADMTIGAGRRKLGYKKIQFCGERARQDGLEYCWVDTCCIDKTNNTELSEAINSMYKWYRRARKCYVYMADVPHSTIPTAGDDDDDGKTWATFQRSRWFTRGWTLQELLAPAFVEFYSQEGSYIGNRKTLERQICTITGIPAQALHGTVPLSNFSYHARRSWQEHWNTTRAEGKAYSLLGICDVSLPLIYGEGADRAFRRLEKAMKEDLHYQAQARIVHREIFDGDDLDLRPAKRTRLDESTTQVDQVPQ
jgi:hypothetical protein